MGKYWKGVGTIAVAIVLIVTAGFNFNFGFTHGVSPIQAWLFGGASIAIDGLKAVMPFAVLGAWRQRQWFRGAGGAILFAGCFAFSCASAIGNLSSSRHDMSAGKEAAQTQRGEALDQLKRTKEKLSWLPRHRPATVVEVELEKAKIDYSIPKIARKTAVQALAIELANAQEDERLTVLEGKLAAALTGTVVVHEADPQAASLAMIFGLPVASVQFAMSPLMAILFEALSAFGLWVIHGGRPEPVVIVAVADVPASEIAAEFPETVLDETIVWDFAERRGRKPVHNSKIEHAMALLEKGRSMQEAAEEAGVGKSTLYRYRAQSKV